MSKEKLKGIIMGAVIMAVLLGGSWAVFAKQATQTIDVVYKDIKLYVDGVLITPKDANGNIVEPFISNGTTYLPVRALSEALGKNVSWDGSTSSVIVGLKPGEVKYFDDIMKPYQTSGYFWLADISKDASISIAGLKYYHGISAQGSVWAYDNGTGLYNLNAQYSQLSGMYGPRDGGYDKQFKINFYVDGRLVKSLEFVRGDMPKDFSVDLTGALQLKIELIGEGASIVNWQIK